MAKLITRTVVTTTVNAATVAFIDGKLETTPLAPLTVMGETVTPDSALRMTRKAHGKNGQYVITSIDVDETTYAMDFDLFMKHAKVISKPDAGKPAAPPDEDLTADAPANIKTGEALFSKGIK